MHQVTEDVLVAACARAQMRPMDVLAISYMKNLTSSDGNMPNKDEMLMVKGADGAAPRSSA